MLESVATSFVSNHVQCWACPVFDALFAIISQAAAAAYKRLSLFSVIIFCILFSFYVFNAFWQNMKKGNDDPLFQKTIKPVLIKSLIALSLLSLGVTVPKIISRITFEPVATMTLAYSKTILPDNYKISDDYQNIQLDDKGFFNPALRDTIMKLLKTSVASFQVYINFGIIIMNKAFSLKALLGIGNLIRHIIIFFMGLFMTYKFAKLFIKYSTYFMDIIVAMAMFAFFFPLSIVLFIFKDVPDVPKWISKLGGNLGSGQIKKLINAIVSVASAILTYTIIMLVIAGFFNRNGVNIESMQSSAGDLFNFNLENSNIMEITFAGIIVLIYVVEYLASQIPEITKKLMETFGVKQEDAMSQEMGENVLQLTGLMADQAKGIFKTVVNPEKVITDKLKEADKKAQEKKDEKPKDKK